MSKKKTIGILAGTAVGAMAVSAHIMKKRSEKTTYEAKNIDSVTPRKMGFYEKYIKRAMDVVCATAAIVCFSPLYIGVAVLVKLKLGSPVLFTQDRPGLIGKDGKETVFKMYKFRTMTDERDENGDLLPDEVRLTKFGAWLRSTSLDELPEAFCILNGTMNAFASVISNNLNIAMKTLTSITIILSIPTMIFSFYGMNVLSSSMPFATNPYGFVIVIVLSVILTCAVAWIFAKRNLF